MMDKAIKHYVQFFAPGSFMANTWTADIEEGQEIEFPENAYGYQRWKRVDAIDGDDVFTGKAERVGKLVYHPDSKVTTIEQVENGDTPGEPGPALLSNMHCNKWDAVVWSRWGNWPQPWEPDRMEIAA